MAVSADGAFERLHDLLSASEVPSHAAETGRYALQPFSAPDGVTFRHETDGYGRTHATFFRNGKAVGSADVREFPYSIQISNFQVARGSRRQGIGTAFQAYIEAKLGKRSVPDGMLSKAEYRRWKKLDPAAVRDYVKGTKSYTPRRGSEAYFAALGGPPVPGSRASQDYTARVEALAAKPSPASGGPFPTSRRACAGAQKKPATGRRPKR